MATQKLPEREQWDKDLYWNGDIPFDDTVDDWTRIPAKELIELLQKAVDFEEEGVTNKGAYFKLREDGEDSVEFQIGVRQTPDDAAYAEIVAKWRRNHERRHQSEIAAKEARELELFKKLKAKYEPRTETIVNNSGQEIPAYTLLHGAELDQMRKDQMQEEMSATKAKLEGEQNA